MFYPSQKKFQLLLVFILFSSSAFAIGGRGGATGLRTVLSQSKDGGCVYETHLLELLRLGEARLSPVFENSQQPLLNEKERGVLVRFSSCDTDGKITLKASPELYDLIFAKSWLKNQAVQKTFDMALKRIIDVVPSFTIKRDRLEFIGEETASRIYLAVDTQNSGPRVQDFGSLPTSTLGKPVQLIVRTGQFYQVMVPDFLSASVLDIAAAWIHDLVYTDSTDADATGTQRVVEYVFSSDYDHDSPEVRRQKFSELGFRFRLGQNTSEVDKAFTDALLLDLTSEKLGAIDQKMANYCNARGMVSCPGYLTTKGQCPVVKSFSYSDGTLDLEMTQTKVDKFFGPLDSTKKFKRKLSKKETAWFEKNTAVLKSYLKETLHANYFPEAQVTERICFKNGKSGAVTELISEILENPYRKDNLEASTINSLREEQENSQNSMESQYNWEACMSGNTGNDLASYRRANLCSIQRSSDSFTKSMMRINKEAASYTVEPMRSESIVRRLILMRTH